MFETLTETPPRQVLAYGVGVSVLLRTAPRWYRHVPVLAMAAQATCLICILLWVETTIPAVQIHLLVVGNLLLVFRFGAMGAVPSTHEYPADGDSDEVAEARGKGGKRQRRASVARMLFNAEHPASTGLAIQQAMAGKLEADHEPVAMPPHGKAASPAHESLLQNASST